jgi:hypothetical protein
MGLALFLAVLPALCVLPWLLSLAHCRQLLLQVQQLAVQLLGLGK